MRINFQRSQIGVPYDVFALQYGPHHFASVFIWQNTDAGRMWHGKLRNSFKYSFKYGVEVWICVMESPKTDALKPPGTVPEENYEHIDGLAGKMNAGAYFHAWKRIR